MIQLPLRADAGAALGSGVAGPHTGGSNSAVLDVMLLDGVVLDGLTEGLLAARGPAGRADLMVAIVRELSASVAELRAEPEFDVEEATDAELEGWLHILSAAQRHADDMVALALNQPPPADRAS